MLDIKAISLPAVNISTERNSDTNDIESITINLSNKLQVEINQQLIISRNLDNVNYTISGNDLDTLLDNAGNYGGVLVGLTINTKTGELGFSHKNASEYKYNINELNINYTNYILFVPLVYFYNPSSSPKDIQYEDFVKYMKYSSIWQRLNYLELDVNILKMSVFNELITVKLPDDSLTIPILFGDGILSIFSAKAIALDVMLNDYYMIHNYENSPMNLFLAILYNDIHGSLPEFAVAPPNILIVNKDTNDTLSPSSIADDSKSVFRISQTDNYIIKGDLSIGGVFSGMLIFRPDFVDDTGKIFLTGLYYVDSDKSNAIFRLLYDCDAEMFIASFNDDVYMVRSIPFKLQSSDVYNITYSLNIANTITLSPYTFNLSINGIPIISSVTSNISIIDTPNKFSYISDLLSQEGLKNFYGDIMYMMMSGVGKSLNYITTIGGFASSYVLVTSDISIGAGGPDSGSGDTPG